MPPTPARIRSRSENESGFRPLALLLFLARQERIRASARQVATLLAAAAAVLLAAVLADHFVGGGLSSGWRDGARITYIVGALVAAAVVVARAIGRRINLAFIAQRVEQAGGIRHNALVNAVLVNSSAATAYARPAALEQAAAAMPSAPKSLPAGRGASRPWQLAAIVLVAWVAYAALSPKSVGTSLQRLFGADLPAPTATQITLIRPAADEIVRINTALEIEFELTGAPVEIVTLTIADQAAAQTREPVAASRRMRAPPGAERRVFSLAPFQIQGDLAYRCVAGDAVLTGVIPVRAMPTLDALEITLVPPAYSRRPVQRADKRDFSALAGTHATFRLVANMPLRQAVFVYDEAAHETRTRLRIDSGIPTVGTLALPLLASGVYRFEITDDAGLTIACRETGRITVWPDQPPRFLGVRELGSLSVDAFVQVIESDDAWPTLEAIAEDDVAVERAWFVLQVGADVSRTPLEVTPGDDEPRRMMVADLSGLVGAAVAEAVAWFEAQDGRVLPDGREAPQTTPSPSIRLIRHAPPERAKRSAAASDTPPSSDTTPPSDRDAPPETPEPTNEGAEDVAGEDSPDGSPAEANPPPPDSGEPSAGDEPIDEAVEEFIREHGQEAAEADRVRRGEDSKEQESSGATSQPSEQAPGVGEAQGQTADAGTQENQDGAEPGDEPANEAPETSGSGAKEANNRGASDTGQAPESPQPGETGKPPAEGEPAEESAESPGSATPGGVENAREAVAGLLEAAERGELISRDELVNAGWPAAKADAFVRNLTHLHALLRRAGGVEVLRARLARTPTAPLLRPGERRDQGAVQLAAEESWEDRLRSLAPPAGEQVPDDLRAMLEAYYRAVAERCARPTPK